MIWGIDLHNISNLEFFSFNRYIYDNHFYGYVYSKSLQLCKTAFLSEFKYSKIEKSPLEIDLSGFGYQNEWLTLQIEEIENWSSGKDISLRLVKIQIHMIILGSNYGKVRVKYIHGFLEKS